MENLNDLIRIQDIAEKAGTSIGTVDRVIHNRTGVSEKTRQRVLEVLKEYNYKPNLVARKSAGKKIFKIAVLLPNEGIAFWKIHPEGINKAAKELKSFGTEVDTFTFEFNSREQYFSQLERIKNEKYDALLVVPIYFEEIYSFLRETKIPSAFFDTTTDIGELDIHFIGENAYQTGMVAGKLLGSGIQQGEMILIVAITNKANSHLKWTDREIGVRHYFANESALEGTDQPQILRIELTDLDPKSIEEKISATFKKYPAITRVFINSCRATSLCAPSLGAEKQNRKNLRIVGYDLTDENILYLKKGIIDFLINKHPREQCYHGIKMLYEYLVLKMPIPAKTYMPIDIIVKENVDYYKMLQVNS